MPAGDRLQNRFMPDTRYPPSTLTASPRGIVKSPPPVDTTTVSPPPMRRSVASAPGSSRRHRQAVNAVTCWCMARARAVEPQWRANSRCTAAIWAIDAPIPPSSRGTASVNMPPARNSS